LIRVVIENIPADEAGIFFIYFDWREILKFYILAFKLFFYS